MEIRQLLALFYFTITPCRQKQKQNSRSQFPRTGLFPLLSHQTSDLLLESKFTSGRGSLNFDPEWFCYVARTRNNRCRDKIVTHALATRA
ncbi:MAG: hypothetical protein PUK76_07670, partial [Treponema sp.]|nr:hypothetical protein [Treponema sp.]